MSDNTKLQANFKLADGTLINVYADNAAEFDVLLNSLLNNVGQIHSVSAALANFTRSAAPSVTETIANELGGQVIASTPAPVAATPAPSANNGYTCKHGAMIPRESKPGAAKPWRGYFCPSPKGTPDQCEPKFLRG